MNTLTIAPISKKFTNSSFNNKNPVAINDWIFLVYVNDVYNDFFVNF